MRTFKLATETFDSKASKKAWESRDRPWSDYQNGREEWLMHKHAPKKIRAVYDDAFRAAVKEAAPQHLSAYAQHNIGHAAGMEAARRAGYRPRRFQMPSILTGIADAIASIDQGF